jgi:hypothetical protein
MTRPATPMCVPCDGVLERNRSPRMLQAILNQSAHGIIFTTRADAGREGAHP